MMEHSTATRELSFMYPDRKRTKTLGPCAFKISHRRGEGMKWFKTADGTVYWLATGSNSEINSILSNELMKKRDREESERKSGTGGLLSFLS